VRANLVFVSRRLKFDIPGPDLRVDKDQVREKGWDSLFADDLPEPFPMVVEIGFGRGEFLWNLAALRPDVAHVGVDVSMKRVLKMARRLARSGIRNIRLVEGAGEEMVRELLPECSVETFWINFSDPWPKKRHHRRRLIQPSFVRDLALRLQPGSCVEIATDHQGYAAWIDEALAAEPLLENDHSPQRFLREVPGRMRTAYQLEWLREGRPLCFWTYRRR
jgi:tRNA (guanine-N7-)-methyltransferase